MNLKSTASINRRKRVISDKVKDLIIKERQYEKAGKEKLSILLKEDGAGIYSHFHAYPRTPKMQSEIERFNRTLSEAFISNNRYLLAYDIKKFNKKLIDC